MKKNLKSKILNLKSVLARTAKQGGFTIIETLVATMILTVALIPLLTLITNSIFSAKIAGDQLTATYLAQEAIDHIRNDRDTNAFQVLNWDNFLSRYGYDTSGTSNNTKCFTTNGCQLEASIFDYPSTNIKLCGSSVPSWGSITCDQFNYDKNGTNGTYYNYNSGNGVLSNFKRKITMDTGFGKDEIVVTVLVEWKNGNTFMSKKLQTSLLNW